MNLATYFLIHDERNIPDVNSEDYRSHPIEYYYDQELNMKNGIEYLLQTITVGLSQEEITAEVFNSAKNTTLNMNEYFKRLYQIIFEKDQGPKIPVFITLLGIDEFKNLLYNRLMIINGE